MEERHEIIEFPEHAPVKIFLHRLGTVSQHWHSSMEILFVLSGQLHAVVDNHIYTLKETDVLLINSNAIHSLSSEGCELAAYQINRSMFSFLPELEQASFFCVSTEATAEQQGDFDCIRQLLARLLKINAEKANSFLTVSVLSELLYELDARFRSAAPLRHVDSEKLQRLSTITDYIRRHYREALTLNQLAEHEHFSVSYLSKFFKENMGVNFTEYYNSIRLEYAVHELLLTNHSVSAVAANNGFSDVRTFVSLFKKQYHMLPSDYRKENPGGALPSHSLPEVNYLAFTTSDSLQKLAKYLEVPGTKNLAPSAEQVRHCGTLSADAPAHALKHTLRQLCCVGSVRELLSAGVQSMLRRVQKEMPFSYIRFHGLLSNDAMFYDETASGTPVFSFSRLDMIFDFLQEIGLKPVLQLSFMPDALAADEKKLAFYMKYNTGQPKDFRRWCLVIETLLTHLIQRYSLREVLTWPIMLWNEPDSSSVMFGYEKNEDFFRLYLNTWKTIKGIHPSLSMGTPPLMLFHDDYFSFSREFFAFCRENDCMPTYININYYADVVDIRKAITDYPTHISQSKLPTNADNLSAFLDLLPKRAAEYGVAKLPLAISEWNLTVNHRNLINDTCYKACYLAKNMAENYDRAETFGYWSLTDYISELQPANALFHGGLGLLTESGIPKPAYHVMKFFFALGSEFLGSGDGYFAAKTPQTGEIQILFYNYCHYSELFANGENFDFGPTNRYVIFPEAKPLKVELELCGLEASAYTVREAFVNQECGSSYDNWIKMGAPQNLSANELEYLKQISAPGLFLHEEHTMKQALRITVSLAAFEVRLVTLVPQF